MGLYNNSGYNTNNIWLVVEPTPLKNMKVSWDDDIPNIWKNKTQSKPPTIYIYIHSNSPAARKIIHESKYEPTGRKGTATSNDIRTSSNIKS